MAVEVRISECRTAQLVEEENPDIQISVNDPILKQCTVTYKIKSERNVHAYQLVRMFAALTPYNTSTLIQSVKTSHSHQN